jgi:hypothetical protein
MSRTALALLTTSLALALAACGAPQPQLSDDSDDLASPAKFIDLEEWVYTPAGSGFTDQYWSIRNTLKSDFDDVCGDTFCGGDYSNLQALSFRCSVEVKTGKLKACQWLFGGSYDTVSKSSGGIVSHAKFFKCVIPAAGTAAAFLKGVTATPATPTAMIDRTVPGATTSFYDALLGCL